ncbi:MAG: DNA methyltransferase, partial [Actinomycetota bacterium]
VQYALEPLVYATGPQNEADPEKWRLRTPAQILDLRVCDPAVGSGAILTAAGRYLADRLRESVAEYGPGEGKFAERLADLSAAPVDEQVVLARREIVDHCLHGVDKNPVAAEMAKLSLWLTTMARERPFTFLDHAIQVGDTLLGITDLEQLRWLHLDPSQRKGVVGFETLALDERISEATDLARRLQELSVVTVRDAVEKNRLHDELRAKLADLAAVADAVVGATLSTAGKRAVTMEERLGTQMPRIRAVLEATSSALERSAAIAALDGIATGWLRTDLSDDAPAPWDRRCLHWPLAFPEVFIGRSNRGFDSVIGNPPFLGGKRISTVLGVVYEAMLKVVLEGDKGAADLSAHFLRRAASISRREGTIGLITTDRISQGDTAQLGLARLLERGAEIYRAWSSQPWPGEANVMIARPYIFNGRWKGQRKLDGFLCQEIGSALRPNAGGFERLPEALVGTDLVVSTGTSVYGEGFVLTPDDVQSMALTADELARLSPYLIASDLTGTPDLRAQRRVINFTDVDREGELSKYPTLLQHLRATVKPMRDSLRGQIHQPHYWKFWDLRPELYTALRELELVIVCPRVSQSINFARVPSGQVFGDRVVVFASDDLGLLAVLQSVVHQVWIEHFRTDMGKAPTYVVSRCFRTFPLPHYVNDDRVRAAGGEYELVREAAMQEFALGLTKIQGMVSTPGIKHPLIESLRAAQVELDSAAAQAYGWDDLLLPHDFVGADSQPSFEVVSSAREEVFRRLMELNHQRYAEEVAAGFHDKKSKKSSAKRAKAPDENQESML